MAAVKVFLVICVLALVILNLEAKKVPSQSEKKEVLSVKKGVAEGGKRNITQQFIYPIFPGTKWCGAGNIAANYSDLGVLDTVDMCCRDHDNCPDYINPFSYSSTFSLANLWPITKLSCECDGKFLNCLKAVNSTAANTVGGIYFNTPVQPFCFRQDYQIIGCKTFYPFPLTRCKEYLYDTTCPNRYQYVSNFYY